MNNLLKKLNFRKLVNKFFIVDLIFLMVFVSSNYFLFAQAQDLPPSPPPEQSAPPPEQPTPSLETFSPPSDFNSSPENFGPPPEGFSQPPDFQNQPPESFTPPENFGPSPDSFGSPLPEGMNMPQFPAGVPEEEQNFGPPPEGFVPPIDWEPPSEFGIPDEDFSFPPNLNQPPEMMGPPAEGQFPPGMMGQQPGQFPGEEGQMMPGQMEAQMAPGQIYLPPPCQEAGLITPEECNNYMQEKGMAPGGQGPAMPAIPPECQEAGLTDPKACQQLMFSKYSPPECQEAGVSNPEDCEKLLKEKYMPEPCKQAGVTDEKDCERIMIEQNLPADCKEAGIKDMAGCEKHMTNLYAPQICQEKGATTPAACEAVVFATFGTPKGCENLLPAECRRLMQEGKVKDEEFMKKINSQLSPECKKLGVTTFEECDELSMKKNVPVECKEAGAFTREACEKVMMEKYQPKDFEIRLPQDCVEAGVKTPEECEKVMKARYFPKECQEAGIENGQDCEVLLAKKYAPPECLAAEAYTKEACESLMRNKYMNPECQQAGINDANACENWMMEKYGKKVECEGISEEECQMAVQKRHLGEIVQKQIAFEEIKEQLNPFIGKHLTLNQESAEGVEGQTEESPTSNLLEAISLVAEEEINLLVLPSNEQTVITENEAIVQTLPAAVMLDDDQDGLPNDLEIRFGSDPLINDSDQDGYTDFTEVQNNHNPIGDGNFTQELAPIDQIIITQQPIDQPLLAGEVASQEFTVEQSFTGSAPEPAPTPAPELPAPAPEAPAAPEPAPAPEAPAPEAPVSFLKNLISRLTSWFSPVKAVASQEATTNNNLVTLTGKGPVNSVITLYIYSEVPIIGTTQTNGAGQWTYTLTKSLSDGEHTVYVAMTNSAGNVVKKSKPFSLLIKNAQAVTAQEFIKDITEKTLPEKTLEATFWAKWSWLVYLGGAVSLVLIILLVLMVIKKKKVNN